MTTEERLDHLERELARIQTGGPDNEVRARRFVLVDENGEARARKKTPTPPEVARVASAAPGRHRSDG